MRKDNLDPPIHENRNATSRSTFIGIAVFLFSFAFYIFTLAPTVIWGDNAYFALHAKNMELNISADSHPLFVILGRLFFYLPFEPAYSLNLLSAVTSSLSVMMIYLIVLEMTNSMASSIIGALSLCFSHAFWHNAVIGRIYGLNVLFVAALVLIFLRWQKESTNNRLLYLAAFLFGLGLSNHLIMILTGIGFLFLIAVINYRVLLRLKILIVGVCFLLLGSSILVYLSILKLMAGKPTLSMMDAATGGEYKRAMLVISPKIFRDIFMYFSYLFYQFPVIGFSLIFIGAFALFRKDRIVAVFLLLLIGVNAFFFLSFGPGVIRTTKYTFYISDYAIFSIFIGYGFFACLTYFRSKGYSMRKVFVLGAALIIILPISLYNVAPYVAKLFGVNLHHARTIPFRDNDTYFLNPSKRGYTGATRYAEKAFEIASLNSIIIADFTPCTVLWYYQEVKGVRKDIRIILSGSYSENIPYNTVATNYGKQDIYLADMEDGYYRIRELKENYNFMPAGVLFKIVKKDDH